MMAMIRCTSSRQAHHLDGSSTSPPVQRRERGFRNSIREGVHCTGPQPLNSTFVEMSFFGGIGFFSFIVEGH